MAVTVEPLAPSARPKRMAVFGPGGHGKTTLALRLAEQGLRVGILDVDDGLAALEYAPDEVRSRISVARVAGLGLEQAKSGWNALKAAPIDVLVVDTFSRLAGDLMYLESGAYDGGKEKERMDAFMAGGSTLIKMLYGATKADRAVIFILHEETRGESAEGQQVNMRAERPARVYRSPRIPSGMAQKEFMDKWDYVWHIRQRRMAGQTGWVITTRPTPSIEAKSRVPADLEATWPATFDANEFGRVYCNLVLRRTPPDNPAEEKLA